MLILPNYNQIHKSLVVISSPNVYKSNREFARTGVVALDAFLKAVAGALTDVSRANNGDEDALEKSSKTHPHFFDEDTVASIFKYFIGTSRDCWI